MERECWAQGHVGLRVQRANGDGRVRPTGDWRLERRGRERWVRSLLKIKEHSGHNQQLTTCVFRTSIMALFNGSLSQHISARFCPKWLFHLWRAKQHTKKQWDHQIPFANCSAFFKIRNKQQVKLREALIHQWQAKHIYLPCKEVTFAFNRALQSLSFGNPFTSCTIPVLHLTVKSLVKAWQISDRWLQSSPDWLLPLRRIHKKLTFPTWNFLRLNQASGQKCWFLAMILHQKPTTLRSHGLCCS